MQARQTALMQIALFSALPEGTREEIAARSGLQRFSAGNVLFVEGERPEYIYALAEGRVALVTQSAGAEAVIEFFGPGDTVLMPAALLDLPYLITARATADGQVVLVPAAVFRDLVDRDVAFAAAVARAVSAQWRLVVTQLKDVKTADARTRVVRYILGLAGAASGAASLPIPGLKKELASRLGMTPETLSRVLRDLQKFGVSADDDTIAVADLGRLREADAAS